MQPVQLYWSTHSVSAKYVLNQGMGVFELSVYKAFGAVLFFSLLCSYKNLSSHSYRKWIPGFGTFHEFHRFQLCVEIH